MSSETYFQRLEAHLSASGITRRPVAVLDLDAFDANARDLLRRAGTTPIRVASKSLRCRALIHRALEHFGAGVLAFSVREAIDLVDDGVSDVVVGYPSTAREDIARLARTERYRECITLMVDSAAHANFISDVARAESLEDQNIKVCLELDCAFAPHAKMHLGALRSPLFTPDHVEGAAKEIARIPHVRILGLMGYESQIAGAPNGGRGPVMAITRALQKASAKDLRSRRGEAVARLRGIADLEFVNGGGTGSIESTTADPSVTEVAAGSGLIGPASFDRFAHFAPQPALFLGFPVVRRSGPGIATLLGGGWIASGPHGADRSPVIVHPPGLRYSRLEGAGEVQTPVLGKAADSLRIGDTVWVRHAKAGEAAEHIRDYVLVSGGEVVDVVPTYRGDGRAYI